ncbi:YrhC family protein [Pontibacillus litoralis]|uniref:Membrane protein n=1 Tax=Pontibacillus litoralis JSM 072002 TaxID=1385512 RepID=A0A0A5G751_9BACI|nr:YrhC family protein [Pontibacillus litoralis]KGX88956.1 membrane protein [Pontibacillus litoralis JSM 072002]
MEQVTELKARIEDYKRFIITLLIMSVYFYLGTLITTYIKPNAMNLLFLSITMISLCIAAFFIWKVKKWNDDMSEYND